MVDTGAAPLRLVGDWPILRAAPSSSVDKFPYVMRAQGTRLALERLILDAAENAWLGLHAVRVVGRGARIQQVEAQCSLAHGMFFDECESTVVDGCTSYQNAGHGFLIRGCNATSFQNCLSSCNDGHGFLLMGGRTIPGEHPTAGGCYLTGFTSEINGGHGVSLYGNPDAMVNGVHVPSSGGRGFVVRDGWIERVKGDGIRVEVWNSTIQSIKISGAGTTPSGKPWGAPDPSLTVAAAFPANRARRHQ